VCFALMAVLFENRITGVLVASVKNKLCNSVWSGVVVVKTRVCVFTPKYGERHLKSDEKRSDYDH